MNRREALKAGTGTSIMVLAGGFGLPGVAMAADDWNKTAFEVRTLNDVVKAMGGTTAAESKDVSFVTAPDIAENGAVVPIAIASKVPKTESISILVEKNPNMLAASYFIPEGSEASIRTPVKMSQTSNVYALVKADGKFFYAVKEVKVTMGGCGG